MDHIIPQDIPQKQCTRCKRFFPATLDFFHAKTRNKDHLRESCKECYGSSKMGVPKLPKEIKYCPHCKQTFPRTSEYFFVKRNAPDGLAGYCKACTHEKYVAKCQSNEPYPHPRPETLICNRCGAEKPATEKFFQRSPMCRYGLHRVCHDCKSTRKRERYWRNPEEARAKQRAYATRTTLHRKKLYHQHGEEIRAYRRSQYARNPQRFKTSQHRYNHSERGLAVLKARGHRRRARKHAVKGTYTPAQIQEQLKRQHYHCYYAACGFSKFPRIKKDGEWKYIYHIEHTFPLSRVAGTDIPANDMSYIVLSCQACNDKKGTRYPHEWPEGGRLL